MASGSDLGTCRAIAREYILRRSLLLLLLLLLILILILKPSPADADAAAFRKLKEVDDGE